MNGCSSSLPRSMDLPAVARHRGGGTTAKGLAASPLRCGSPGRHRLRHEEAAQAHSVGTSIERRHRSRCPSPLLHDVGDRGPEVHEGLCPSLTHAPVSYTHLRAHETDSYLV